MNPALTHPISNRYACGLWLLLLLCWYGAADGQYFSRHYSLYAGTNGYISSIQVVNDTIYAMCYVGDSIDPALGIAAFERFDKYGNRISYNPLPIPNCPNVDVSFNNLIKTNDGGLAYIGNALDTNINQVVLLLWKFDRNGVLQWYKEFIYPNYNSLYCDACIQDKFSNYYMTGTIANPITNDNDIYLMKADSTGTLIYEKEFLHQNFYDAAWGICLNNKDQIVIGGDALSYNISNLSSAKDYMEIYVLDTAGNQLNYILGTDTNGPQAYNILSTQDGGYMIASSYYCYRDPSTLKWMGSVAKLDSNFNEVWKIDKGSCSNTGFFGLKLGTDGNYIAVGQSSDAVDIVPHVNGWIIKFSENGQIFWSNLYRGVTSDGPNGDNNVLGSVAFMSDNSIICSGQATNDDLPTNPQQQGWLLHLDSAGCLPDSNSCGIPDGITDVPPNLNKVLVYPDPASDQITVAYTPDGSTAEIILYNLLGQQMWSKATDASGMNSIDIRSFPAGLYFYKLTSAGGMNASGDFVISR